MSLVSSRKGKTLSDFLTSRETLFKILKSKDHKITSWSSQVSNTKQLNSFPQYVINLSVCFTDDKSIDSSIDLVNSFIPEADPRLIVTLLEDIKTEGSIKSVQTESLETPELIYIGSECSLEYSAKNDHINNYILNISVCFCDAESFDDIARRPITPEAFADKIKRNFNE